ncbi:MAG TPA: hypothetical protein VLR26_13560, partial [Frankiaceae bacterium]|nr:hypothetical protein [Frankiaceae bacterium]
VGAPGPVGLPGVQGPQGASGPAWSDQPSPAELVAKVREAAFDLTPRTVLDPRLSARYVSNLVSKIVKLQGGLLLRAIVTINEVEASESADRSNVRSISA